MFYFYTKLIEFFVTPEHRMAVDSNVIVSDKEAVPTLFTCRASKVSLQSFLLNPNAVEAVKQLMNYVAVL